MANRFTDTGKWNEDWYVQLAGEYQKLWDYICDFCDNAGVWKPNKIDFESKTKFTVDLNSFLQKVNADKERILVLGNGRWFLTGFIKYQWFTKKDGFELNLTNKLHLSMYKILIQNAVPFEKVRGLEDPLKGSSKGSATGLGRGLTRGLEGVFDGSATGHGKGIGNNKEDNTNTDSNILFETPSKGSATGLEGVLISQSFTPPSTIPPRPAHAPPLQQVIEFFYQQGKKDPKDAEKFFNHYEGLGWMKGITPITAWRSFAQNWIANPIQTKTTNHVGNKQTPKGDIIQSERNYGKF